MKKPSHGGGWQAIWYTLARASESGGWWKFYRALSTKNACKTCALGMGGQKGGMVNEAGHFPEVCKKSAQAMAADMQGGIPTQFFAGYSLPQLAKFTPRQLEKAGRITQPMIVRHGESYYQPVSWEDALQRITSKLRSLRADESFFYFSGRSSNEAGFLLQLFARLYGTNNVNNCSYYCHQASGVGLTSSTGSGTATITLDDVEHADCVFLIGGNPASNHPRLMRTLMNVRRSGGEVIVINPMVEVGLVNFKVPSDVKSMLFGSPIASLYVQPHVGGDLALLHGIGKRLLEVGGQDEAYLQAYCNGWPELKQYWQNLDWTQVETLSGVSRKTIDDIAQRYRGANRVVFSWTMGITHHAHGVENVQAIANLALARGMVGRPHAGLMPIRGHSNVQGIGSVGVTPQLKKALFERLESHFGVKLPTQAGKDTLACMESANEGTLKFGLCLGGNLYGSNPDSGFADKALANLEMLVHLNTTLNTGHAHGIAKETILLPVLARDEEPQPTTQESMFNYVRLSDGGRPRHEGPKSEIEVISRIAEGTLGSGGPLDWKRLGDAKEIRKAIAEVVPGFEKMAEIDRTRKEFQIDGRTLHAPKFPTATGKAALFVHSLPIQHSQPDQLRLMTVRSEGQFNTVVYDEYDLYRGQERRDVILVHPDDIQRLGLQADSHVSVTSDTGRMDGVILRAYPDLRAGNAVMYYPESNVLVSRHVDPQSRTPAFKNVLVRVTALERRPMIEHRVGALSRELSAR